MVTEEDIIHCSKTRLGVNSAWPWKPYYSILDRMGKNCFGVYGVCGSGCNKDVWKSRASWAPLGEWKKKNLFFFAFRQSYDTCINVTIFFQGQNFYFNNWSPQKKPVNHDLYAFWRTKMPKWSREPNDRKVVLREQKIFFRRPGCSKEDEICSVINSSRPSDTCRCRSTKSSLVQIIVCCLFNIKPLSQPMLVNCELDPCEHIILVKLE